MIKHIIFGIIVAVALTYIALQYAVIEPVPFVNPEPVEFKGPLQINTVLADGKQLLLGSVGPESIEIDSKGNLYTGLADGRIIKVHPSATGDIGEGLAEDIFSGPIKGVNPVDNYNGPGRPLGMRIHGGNLYVIDSYLGLYSINLKTKAVRPLVKPDGVNPPMKFPNDLDITKDGKVIYFTDTSYKWNLALLSYDLLEGLCLGRLFKLEISTGHVEEVVSNLCFANGVQLSQDESTVAIAETSRYRVKLFDTESWKVKKVVVVPGMPDNIRGSKGGGYWVALPIVRSWLVNVLPGQPMLRKIITGILPPHIIASFAKTGSGLGVELDQDGNIVRSVHDQEGKTSRTVSQITEIDSGYLFAGSYKAPFMVKIKL